MTLGLGAPAAATAAATPTIQLPGTTTERVTSLPVELHFEVPPDADQALARLRNIDPEALEEAFDRTGAPENGPPIRVILAREGSALATRVPPYITGYAYGHVGVVVLLVDRVPTFPNHSMEELLRHEIAHVLIDRAAANQPVPRWFHEGLATSIGNRWSLQDSSRAHFASRRVRDVPITELGPYFRDPETVNAAYAASTDLVRYYEKRYGHRFPALLLGRVAEGVAFDEAFYQLTGITLLQSQGQFLSQDSRWLYWFLWITSDPVLWGILSLLALYAMKRRRDRLRERLEAWEEEERQAAEEEALARARSLEAHRLGGPTLVLVPSGRGTSLGPLQPSPTEPPPSKPNGRPSGPTDGTEEKPRESDGEPDDGETVN
ncbi:MAG: hypothetical protein AAGD01_01490 [Acidobacteriota bacterium]